VIKSLSLGLNHETQPEQTLCERFESNVIFTQLIFCHLSHLFKVLKCFRKYVHLKKPLCINELHFKIA